jgi:hypothetical protein
MEERRQDMAAEHDDIPCLFFLKDGAVGVHIYVQPKASKSAFIGLHDGCLKLAISSPPVDNKANKAVISFVAEFLQVPQKNIMLCAGEKSRRKVLCIDGMTMAELRRRIEPILQENRNKL